MANPSSTAPDGMAARPPWIPSYPDGVQWDMPLTVTDVAHFLEDAAARWPDQPAIDFLGRKISYRELNHLAGRMACGLQRLGVGPGVHVGLYLGNVPQYIIAFFGVLKAGGTVVNYSPLDARQVLRHKIEDSRTDVLFTLDSKALYDQVRPLLQGTRLKTLVVGTPGEFGARPDDANAAAGPRSPVTFGDGCIPFAQLLDNDGRYRPQPISDPAKTLAVLQYSGGTTGLPKGAMLTHANLSAATAQLVGTYVSRGPLAEGRERFLTALPLFHVYAMVCNMLFAVRIGAENVLVGRFDGAAAATDIAERKISCFPGVPTMFSALVSLPDAESFDLRSLKVCCSGGAPLPVELLHRFQQLTGCKLTEGWGMTETTACGTFTPELGKHKPGSCGIPQIGVTIRFLDVSDPSRVLPMGEQGEIAVAGPNVMMGYWNNPQATREAHTADGFFRTGDVGYMDEEGFMYIVDRTKDMLLCSGFNVYPRVIEEAIYAHPGVEEVLVIGVPDAYRGQSPKAYVKLRHGQAPFSLEVLKEFLRDRLGKHEMVQALEFRDALPRTPVGKLSKKMLQDELAHRGAPA